MATSDSDFDIKITSDSSQAQSDIGDLANKTSGYGDAAEAAGGKAKEGGETIGAVFGELREQAAELFAGEKLVEYGEEIIELADKYDELDARIKLATGNQADFEEASAGVLDIAQRQEQSLESVSELYLKLNEATKNLGLTQQQVLGLTDALTSAVRLQGGTAATAAEEASGLARGLADGSVSGKAFSGALEHLPALADAVAQNLGLTREQLKQLAADGGLSAKTLTDAILASQQQLAASAKELPETVSGAITNFQTAIGKYAQSLNDSNGLSTKAISIISTLAQNIDLLGNVAVAGAEVSLVKLTTALINKSIAAVQATAAAKAETAAALEEANTAIYAAAAEQQQADGKALAIKLRVDAAEAANNEALAQLETAKAYQEAALAEAEVAKASAQVALALGDQELATQTLALATDRLVLTEKALADADRAQTLTSKALSTEQAALSDAQTQAALAAEKTAAAQTAVGEAAAGAGVKLLSLGTISNGLIAALVGYQVLAPIFEKLGTAIGEYAAKLAGADEAAKEQSAARIAQLEQELDKLDPVLAGLQQYNNVQALSAEAVQKLGSTAQAAYKAQLDGLQTLLLENNSVLLREQELAQQRGLNTKEYDTELANNTASLQRVRAAQNDFTAAMNTAADALQNHVSVQAQLLADKFDAGVKSGKSLTEEIAEIGKGLDPQSVKSVNDYVSALGLLESQGKITSNQLELSLGAELKSLSAEALANFAVNASAAFEGVSGKAALLGQTLETVRNEQLAKLGVDAQQAAIGISKAVSDSIVSIKSLASNTTTTAQQMQAALQGALNAAKTQEEAQAIITAVSGIKLAGFDAAASIAALQGAIDKLPSEADRLSPLEEALKRLGVESQTALNAAAKSATDDFNLIQSSGTESIGVVANAFAKMAAAQLAAAQAQGDTAEAIVAGNLRAAASTEQEQAALDKLASTYPALADAAVDADAKIVNANNTVSSSYSRVGSSAQSAGQQGASAMNDVTNATDDAGDAAADLATYYTNLYSQFQDMSQAAGDAFNKIISGTDIAGTSVLQYTNDVAAALNGPSGLVSLANQATQAFNSSVSALSQQYKDTAGSVSYLTNAIKLAQDLLTNSQYLTSAQRSTLQSTISSAQDQLKTLQSQSAASTSSAASPSASTSTTTATPAASSTVRIELVIGNQTTDVNVASQADANALIAALQAAKLTSIH